MLAHCCATSSSLNPRAAIAWLMLTLLSLSPCESSRTVVNPHDFVYMLNNPNLCSSAEGDVYMFIWIHSRPDHFKKRLLIRETWGNPSNFHDINVRTAFLMGDPRNATIQALLNLEFERYGDMIQEDFVDSYRNLTYKAVMGFKWVSTHCNATKIVFKADDDMVVDIFRLMHHIKSLQQHGIGIERTILCNYWENTRVDHNKKSKWSVTKEEFESDIYPQYCSGMAVLMTPDLMHPLFVESLYVPFFWVDDVYFSGILPKNHNVTYHTLSSLTSHDDIELDKYLSPESDMVFVHVHNEDIFCYLWTKMVHTHRLSAIAGHRALYGKSASTWPGVSWTCSLV